MQRRNILFELNVYVKK